jgi:hypothetical protein
MAKPMSGPPGCAKQGANAVRALTLIAALLGILRRLDRKGGKR